MEFQVGTKVTVNKPRGMKGVSSVDEFFRGVDFRLSLDDKGNVVVELSKEDRDFFKGVIKADLVDIKFESCNPFGMPYIHRIKYEQPEYRSPLEESEQDELS